MHLTRFVTLIENFIVMFLRTYDYLDCCFSAVWLRSRIVYNRGSLPHSLFLFWPVMINIRFDFFKSDTNQYRCQFHQHFTCSFFIWKSFKKLFCTYCLGLYFFGGRKLAQKLLVKCWWNWLQVYLAIWRVRFVINSKQEYQNRHLEHKLA